jgi:hypothetical protein
VGVKYTPIPPLSVSVTQRKAEGGRQDTVVGLSFTYPFDLSWSQLTRRTRGNNSATVEGFRYEFVKRENRIPLARREKTEPKNPAPPVPISIAFDKLLYTVSGTTSSDDTEVQVNVTGIADGAIINWSITSSPGTTSKMATFFAPSSTVNDGKATVLISGADVQREVTITATLDSDPSITVEYPAVVRFGDPLPSSFLALYNTGEVASSMLSWADAEGFCTDQGGRLPLINGQTSSGPVSAGTSIEGFGTVNGPWPDPLPYFEYWSGTLSSFSGWSFISYSSYYNYIVLGDGSYQQQVACVSQP